MDVDVLVSMAVGVDVLVMVSVAVGVEVVLAGDVHGGIVAGVVEVVYAVSLYHVGSNTVDTPVSSLLTSVVF